MVCESRADNGLQRPRANVFISLDCSKEWTRKRLYNSGLFDLVLACTDSVLSSTLEVYTEYTSNTGPRRPSALIHSRSKIISVAKPRADDHVRAMEGCVHINLFRKYNSDGLSLRPVQLKFDFFRVQPSAEQLKEIAILMNKGLLGGTHQHEVLTLDRGGEALKKCEKMERVTLCNIVIRVSPS